MKKKLTMMAWAASVMLVLSMVFAACNNKKSKSEADDEDEDETELAEDMDDDADDESITVDVTNAREFILALKDDVHINVLPGEPLNLTKAIDELIDEGKLSRYTVEGEEQTAPGVYWDPEYDGNTLFIVSLRDLTIEGVNDDGGFLMTTPRYSDVLHFESCHRIEIKNMTLGHEETGDCVGDVLVLNGCGDITVEKCNLFGCGVNGIYTSHSKDISVKATDIYGCSMRGLEAYTTKNMKFNGCNIFNNGSGIYVDDHSRNISFDNCKFNNNRGQLFMCYSDIVVKNSSIEHHYDDITEHVQFIDSDVEMDYAETDDLPDIEPDYE